MGADARSILSSAIVVDNNLANMCKGVPRCSNYGLSPSCPPHVSGPNGFKKWQMKSRYSIVIKLDLSSDIMISNQYKEILFILHSIVAGIEEKAKEIGFYETKSFAGGSCKDIFCYTYPSCNLLSKQKKCRNPKLSRPSMSGFGINVMKLIQSAGWPLKSLSDQSLSHRRSMSWVSGLVLLG